MDELILRNAIHAAIKDDILIALNHTDPQTLENTLVMIITNAIIEYDKLKTQTIPVFKTNN